MGRMIGPVDAGELVGQAARPMVDRFGLGICEAQCLKNAMEEQAAIGGAAVTETVGYVCRHERQARAGKEKLVQHIGDDVIVEKPRINDAALDETGWCLE